MDSKEIRWEDVKWFHLAQDMDKGQAPVNSVMKLRASRNARDLLASRGTSPKGFSLWNCLIGQLVISWQQQQRSPAIIYHQISKIYCNLIVLNFFNCGYLGNLVRNIPRILSCFCRPMYRLQSEVLTAWLNEKKKQITDNKQYTDGNPSHISSTSNRS